MTTQSLDEEKAKSFATAEFDNGEEMQTIFSEEVYAGYLAGLHEARTESQSEIAKLRELLERAERLIDSAVADFACEHESYSAHEKQWLRDYAALTKGEK